MAFIGSEAYQIRPRNARVRPGCRRQVLENGSFLYFTQEGHQESVEAVGDLLQRRQAPALQDLDEEELEARPVAVHQVLDVVVVEGGDLLLHLERRDFVPPVLEPAQGLDQPDEAQPEEHGLLPLGREVGEDGAAVQGGLEGLRELDHRLLEAVLQYPVAVLDPRAHAVGLAGGRDVLKLGVQDLLELEGHAIDERVVELVERSLGIEAPKRPLLDEGQEHPGLGRDEGKDEHGAAQGVL
jgi:hypothetical protein